METNVFTQHMDRKQIFKKNNREILRPSYIPGVLPHRQEEIDSLASVLVTALKGERPSNILIFGKTGTGKTACVKFIGNEIKKADADGKKVTFIYMNCEVVDTAYGVMQNIGNQFVQDFDQRIPFTGLSIMQVYNLLKEKLDELDQVVIIALDEIDKLVYKSGDDVLYHLCKINDDLKNARVSTIGISNDLLFTEMLDPRVRSRMEGEKMVFPPYNADQLKDILRQRSELAFDEGALEEAVIPLCAALAAQEHGDARRALDLLRIAAEIAERENADKVAELHVLKAKNKMELDCVSEAIRTLPKQSKMVLMCIVMNVENGVEKITTGDVYETYQDISRILGTGPLTQRRITDFISELDMLGIIHARVRSFGRGGRTKEIDLGVPLADTRKVLEEDEVFIGLKNYKQRNQTTLM
ncbi:MAG: ORC1-type DNA replication protein [Methanomassiliicoccales archaeon]|nr:ORC1-type DNA replication protein [Methanomassiliicoccales archaeon]